MHETQVEKNARELAECRDMLKLFFVNKDRLESELRAVNANIDAFGRGYWTRLGYSVMPRLERLRAAILGEQK